MSAANANTNFGSATTFKVDQSPMKRSLLRFTVSGVAGAVTSATLRLYNVNPSDVGGEFTTLAPTSPPWTEAGVTWTTAPPAAGPIVASLGRVAKDRWYEVDVTAIVTGNGTFEIGIASGSSDVAAYASKEAAASKRPQLVVAFPPGPPDTTHPSAEITSPAGGATVSGIVTVTASASDDVGVTTVELLVDGAKAAEDWSDPYAFAWNTSRAPNGSHVLKARALDAAGNATESAAVEVTVFNEPDTRPVVSFGAAGDHGAQREADATLAKLDASGVDFYLALGDLDYDQTPSDEAWCAYVKNRLPALGDTFPFQLVSGNHEEQGGSDGYILNHAACLPDRMASTFGPNSQYGAEYYFDYPSGAPLVRVVMLPAALRVANQDYTYAAGSVHYNWVSGVVDDARARGIPWVVAGMHKNCITVGVKSCSIGEALLNLLVAKKVDLVLQGHEHNYQRSKQLAHVPGTCNALKADAFDADCVAGQGTGGTYVKGAGTLIVITGTFGRGLYSVSPGDSESGYFARFDATTWGFTRLTVSADRIDGDFVRSIGSFTDTFSIS